MPTFETVPLSDAEIRTATGKRAVQMQEYLGYVAQLEGGQAGKLQAAEGETAASVRRRLGAAAKLSGKDIVIKRAGEEIYFWLRDDTAKTTRRRGRARRPYASAS